MTIVTDYSLDASTKTITLGYNFSSTSIEQITKISNLTRNIEIYDYQNPRKHRQLRQEAGMDISVAGGKITYIENAVMNNSDIIQIIIDPVIVANSTGGGNTTIIIDPVTVYSGQVIAASSELSSPGVPTGNCTKLNVYFSNTGTSTNVEITVKGSPTPDLTLSKIIGDPITLGAGTSNGPIIEDSEIPGDLWFTIKNKDTSKTAIITITVDRYIGGYIQTNTTLFLNNPITASGSATSGDAFTGAARRVSIYCAQTGPSTDTTFNVYGKSNQFPAIPKWLATCNLGSGKQWGCGLLTDVIPGSVYVIITNADSVRASEATVLVESFT